jgi:kynureninase
MPASGAFALARHYSRFRVSERLLLTGHSHQAWPDVAFAAQQQAWLDAAELVDDKWERAYEVAERTRAGWRRLLNTSADVIALGQSTHELVIRFLSALELRRRPRLVTTDGEFHTLRRQLARLAEEGVQVVRVPARPVESLAERVAAAVDDRTAAVLMSSVLFETAEIVPHLHAVARACERTGAELLIDAYHHLNVVPFSIADMGVENAFVTGGGYKYCQLGEGNCFLRVPPGREHLRPVITGWFSEFDALAAARSPGEVQYGRGDARWAGATYDPTAHYRAAAVFDFFEQQGLTPARLREISQHQVGLLAERCEPLRRSLTAVGIDAVGLRGVGGFLALRMGGGGDAGSPDTRLRAPGPSNVWTAGGLVRRLRERGVLADHRGDILRLGPAPYMSDSQLEAAGAILASTID